MEFIPEKLLIMDLEPIAYLRSQRTSRFLAPRQPGQAPAEVCARVELVPGRHLDAAIEDLSGFTRIWLIWCFHKNSGWRPKVLPPRGRSGRKGVLATRSPHRPNPLGISAIPLLGVEGLNLLIGEHDLMDGTPILDIKPYLPSVDSFPEEAQGWLDQLEPLPKYTVHWTPLAGRQRDYLVMHHHSEIAYHVEATLENDPLPLRSRRIHKVPGGHRLGCGPWRVFYQIEGHQVLIERITDNQGNPVGE